MDPVQAFAQVAQRYCEAVLDAGGRSLPERLLTLAAWAPEVYAAAQHLPYPAERPLQQRPVQTDGNALMLGFAGVYSSFLLHTERAAKRFDVDPRDILVELGKRHMVGGQEDMIVDVALALSKA